jgi:hypothetical protein
MFNLVLTKQQGVIGKKGKVVPVLELDNLQKECNHGTELRENLKSHLT